MTLVHTNTGLLACPKRGARVVARVTGFAVYSTGDVAPVCSSTWSGEEVQTNGYFILTENAAVNFIRNVLYFDEINCVF